MTSPLSRQAYCASDADATSIGLQYRFERGQSTQSPIALLLHGRAGDCHVPWVFRRCFPKDFHVLSLQAPYPDPIGGFSWWPEYASAYKERSLSISIAEHALDAFDKLLDYEGLEPSHCMALGFSQGAALLSCILQIYPEVFSKLALLAGLCIPLDILPKTPQTCPSRRTSLLWIHGRDDDVIPVSQAHEGSELLRSYGFALEFLEEQGLGHKVGIQGMRRLKDYFA